MHDGPIPTAGIDDVIADLLEEFVDDLYGLETCLQHWGAAFPAGKWIFVIGDARQPPPPAVNNEKEEAKHDVNERSGMSDYDANRVCPSFSADKLIYNILIF